MNMTDHRDEIETAMREIDASEHAIELVRKKTASIALMVEQSRTFEQRALRLREELAQLVLSMVACDRLMQEELAHVEYLREEASRLTASARSRVDALTTKVFADDDAKRGRH